MFTARFVARLAGLHPVARARKIETRGNIEWNVFTFQFNRVKARQTTGHLELPSIIQRLTACPISRRVIKLIDNTYDNHYPVPSKNVEFGACI